MGDGAINYRRFLDGDDDGIVEIIREYKDGLILYLNGYVDNIWVAEELVEETFFRIVTKKPKFSGRSTFKTWLYSIGRNVALDCLRKRKRVDVRSVEDSEKIIGEGRSFEKEYLEQERKIVLYKAMQNIPANDRRVLHLKFFEGFTIAEIALIIGKSVAQVNALMRKAKQALKEELERGGFEYEEL
ncbi:MAG: RNA polymerase sigma factor [Clostridia bacterium]|nr:RNA polymerase sigma factor [Clostridia bacterium]